jgi:purine-nucleoside phosphorylase
MSWSTIFCFPAVILLVGGLTQKGIAMSAIPVGQPLLLAAFPPELAGLDQDPPPGWQVRCTGVGAVTAAVATSELLATLKPSRVLFVGTCGAYDERLAVGDLIEATEALSVSLEEVEGRAYRPAIERVRWPATLVARDFLGFPAHPVAVPMVITKTLEGAQALSSCAPAEHLELTGVFAACHGAGIPCAAALAVADRVGPNAHVEWKANNIRVSQALIRALKDKGVFEQE